MQCIKCRAVWDPIYSNVNICVQPKILAALYIILLYKGYPGIPGGKTAEA
jgi:hypothetical protein